MGNGWHLDGTWMGRGVAPELFDKIRNEEEEVEEEEKEVTTNQNVEPLHPNVTLCQNSLRATELLTSRELRRPGAQIATREKPGRNAPCEKSLEATRYVMRVANVKERTPEQHNITWA